MKWVGVTEDNLIECLNPKDKLVHEGASVSHLLDDRWKSLLLQVLDQVLQDLLGLLLYPIKTILQAEDIT